MNSKPIAATGLAWAVLSLLVCSQFTEKAIAADPGLKLEAQLIWGTNDPQSPDPSHKPVDSDVLKKLAALPLKWSNYFSVNRKGFNVPLTTTCKVPLSEKCRMEVK